MKKSGLNFCRLPQIYKYQNESLIFESISINFFDQFLHHNIGFGFDFSSDDWVYLYFLCYLRKCHFWYLQNILYTIMYMKFKLFWKFTIDVCNTQQNSKRMKRSAIKQFFVPFSLSHSLVMSNSDSPYRPAVGNACSSF